MTAQPPTTSSRAPGEVQKGISVTADNFVRAETDM